MVPVIAIMYVRSGREREMGGAFGELAAILFHHVWTFFLKLSISFELGVLNFSNSKPDTVYIIFVNDSINELCGCHSVECMIKNKTYPYWGQEVIQYVSFNSLSFLGLNLTYFNTYFLYYSFKVIFFHIYLP